MIQFPMTENGNSSHDVTLFGQVYTFAYKYNTRNQRVYLSIYKDGVVLINGIRLVALGFPIQQYPLTDFPPIQLYVGLLGNGVEPTLGNFGINKEFSLIGVGWEDV